MKITPNFQHGPRDHAGVIAEEEPPEGGEEGE